MSTTLQKDSIVPDAQVVSALGATPVRSMRWSRDEKKFLALALSIIALWGGATLLFGWTGFISTALAMVPVIGVWLIYLTLGLGG